MNLQQMEYIVALDKYRHFVLAAEACGVTQPTLSAMIQKLEEELDVKVFNRDRKNITPTPIGEKIIRQAQIALNETQRIKELVADETGSMTGSLRIGVHQGTGGRRDRQYDRQPAHRCTAHHRPLSGTGFHPSFPESLSGRQSLH